MYLNRSKLKPGDVLLTSEKDPSSKVIAKVTDGPYSHSAIVLNSTTLFESRGDGILFTFLEADRVERSNNSTRILTNIESRNAIVLRHPELEYYDNGDLRGKINKFIKEHIGYEYPSLEELSHTFEEKSLKKKISEPVLKIVDNRGEDKYNPGVICSELVVLLFDHLGEDLFAEKLDRKASPNDLLGTNLEEVEDAITEPSKDAELLDDLKEVLNKDIPSREELTELVKTSREVKIVEKGLDELDKIHKSTIESILNILDNLSEDD